MNSEFASICLLVFCSVLAQILQTATQVDHNVTSVQQLSEMFWVSRSNARLLIIS